MVELFCEDCSSNKQFEEPFDIDLDNTVTCPDCGGLINVDDTPLEDRKH